MKEKETKNEPGLNLKEAWKNAQQMADAINPDTLYAIPMALPDMLPAPLTPNDAVSGAGKAAELTVKAVWDTSVNTVREWIGLEPDHLPPAKPTKPRGR